MTRPPTSRHPDRQLSGGSRRRVAPLALCFSAWLGFLACGPAEEEPAESPAAPHEQAAPVEAGSADVAPPSPGEATAPAPDAVPAQPQLTPPGEPQQAVVGETIELPYSAHTIVSAGIEEFPSFNERALILRVRVENRHPSHAMIYNPFFYIVVDSAGRAYTPMAVFALADEMLQPGTLPPGETVEGVIGYPIPNDPATARLSLAYGGVEHATVALGLHDPEPAPPAGSDDSATTPASTNATGDAPDGETETGTTDPP